MFRPIDRSEAIAAHIKRNPDAALIARWLDDHKVRVIPNKLRNVPLELRS